MHLINSMSYAELIHGLSDEILKGYVKSAQKHTDSGVLSLFNYTQKCVIDKAWTPYSLVARGLILDELACEIVALPFEKFFNYGENGYDIPDEPFATFEKLDGSLGIVYFYGGKWNVATRGSFDSEQAQWAEKWLHEHVNFNKLAPELTYLTEIIYPENRIVVNYDFEGLVLLSAYNRNTFKEYLSPFGSDQFREPKSYRYVSLDGLLEIAKTLPANDEGFVVRFDSGKRLKIKGDEYCRVHRLISEVTPLGIWRAMMAGDDLNAIKEQIPEEYHHDFDVIQATLSLELGKFLVNLRAAEQHTEGMSDKELGLYLKSDECELAEIQKRWIFAVRKQNLLEEMYKPGLAREKVFKTFRPTGNRLEGYRPSTIMNRFEEAA